MCVTFSLNQSIIVKHIRQKSSQVEMEMLRIFDTHIENQKSTREIQDGELGPGYRGYFYTNVAMSREGIALG